LPGRETIGGDRQRRLWAESWAGARHSAQTSRQGRGDADGVSAYRPRCPPWRTSGALAGGCSTPDGYHPRASYSRAPDAAHKQGPGVLRVAGTPKLHVGSRAGFFRLADISKNDKWRFLINLRRITRGRHRSSIIRTSPPQRRYYWESANTESQEYPKVSDR
jgi:hypothetical protein